LCLSWNISRKSAKDKEGASELVTEQLLPYFGGFKTEYTESILYKCRNVGVVG